MNRQIGDNAGPFLTDTDYLYLGGEFSVSGTMLNDNPLGAHHRLSEPGGRLVSLLIAGTTYQNFCAAGRQLRADEWQCLQVLAFLNTIGALKRRRELQCYPRACSRAAHAWLVGARYAPLVRREAATYGAIFRGVLRALVPVGLAGFLSGALVAGTGMFPAHAVAGYGFGIFGIFAVSLYVHESAHFWLLRRHGIPCVTMQRGLRLGLVHRRQPHRLEWQVATLGPCAGGLFCMLAAATCYGSGISGGSVAALLAGSFHLGSFLPWYADGAVLYGRQRRFAHATDN